MTTHEQMLPEAAPAPAEPPISDAVIDATIDDLLRGGIGWGETARFALDTLRANPQRTILTTLGVLIGVAAVVALLAIGRGSQEAITAAITANGANLLTIRSAAANVGGIRSAIGEGQTLTLADAEALADPALAPSVAYVSPEIYGTVQLVAGANNLAARGGGVLPAFALIRNITVTAGSFITDEQVQTTASVVVLGANAAATLFPDGKAVDQQVRINRQSFRVVGVLAAQGGTSFGSIDDGVLMPLTTAQRKLIGARALGGSAGVQSIVVQATGSETVNAALVEISAILRERHDRPPDGSADDFSVINQQDILDTVAETTRMLTLFLAAIAAISLLVGGIGIMNIMLVSVRERTREIGLRKALGAREGDILLQFLFEALALSGVGGLAGLLLGIAIALAANQSGLLSASLSWDAAALAFGFALAVGLFFGIAPARSAARLDPIVALRYE